MPLDDSWLGCSKIEDLPKVSPVNWFETSQAEGRPLIAQNLETGDKVKEASSKIEQWQPDKIFLGIDVTGSMSEAPLSGMSQFTANCAGDKQSMFGNMTVDSRSKLEQLKDVLATFVSGLDDVKNCTGRIFGLSVDRASHTAFFDSNKKNSEQTGLIFGDGEGTLGRREIVERIKKLQPKGPATAVANAIDQCRIDAEKGGSQRPLLVLWTDGQENCGGNVCQEIEKFATEFQNGRIVVFGLDPTVKEQFDCVGLKALGKRFQYVDARDPNKSLEVLGKMSNQDAHGNLVNQDAHGTLVNKDAKGKLLDQELNGTALPYKPDGDRFYGEVFGELMRRKGK